LNERRHVLITGTTRGLGQALAVHLLEQGDLVIGCARSCGTIDHKNYVHVTANIADDAQTEQLFRQVREFDRLDILINSAGTARMLPLALTPDETVQKIMDLNFIATVRMIHRAIRLMRKSKCPRIVNLTSVAVPLRLQGESIYAASKAAVEMLTRIVAKEFGPLGVTCNAVGPSPIRTDLIRNVPEEKLNALIAQQAVPTWAQADDVINVVDFFLRPESRMITGQVIYLGGMG
jgi:3-oxoacyl-[acyl-carrier protein] reductase